MKPKEPRIAYALLPSQLADPSIKQLDVIIVQEGENGYHPTDWKWNREHAIEAMNKKNKDLGLTPEEAEKIFVSSLFAPLQAPPKVLNRKS